MLIIRLNSIFLSSKHRYRCRHRINCILKDLHRFRFPRRLNVFVLLWNFYCLKVSPCIVNPFRLKSSIFDRALLTFFLHVSVCSCRTTMKMSCYHLSVILSGIFLGDLSASSKSDYRCFVSFCDQTHHILNPKILFLDTLLRLFHCSRLRILKGYRERTIM